MRLNTLFFSYMILLMISVSCRKTEGEIMPILDKVDSLASISPKSADYLLDSLYTSFDYFTKAETMRWKLLRIKTDDKQYAMNSLAALSTLDSLEDYYKSHDDRLLLAETYFYKGRANADTYDSHKAMDYFSKALQITEGAKEFAEFESIIYSQIAYIYIKLGFKDKAVENYKNSLYKSYVTRIPKSILQSEILLANAYDLNGNDDESRLMRDKALIHAREINDSSFIKLLAVQQGQYYLDHDNVDKADSIWNTVAGFKESPHDEEFVRNFEAKLLLKKGETEKAIDIYKWILDNGNDIRKAVANRNLFYYYLDERDITMAGKYGKAVISLLDSIFESRNKIFLKETEIDNLLRRYSSEEEVLRKKADDMTSLVIVLFIVIAVITSVSIILCIRLYKYRKTNNIDISNDELTAHQQIFPTPSGIDPESKVQNFKNKIRMNVQLTEPDWIDMETALVEQVPSLGELIADLHLEGYELKITLLLRLGYRNKDISAILFKSPNTITSSRTRMEQKYFNPEGTAKDWDRRIVELS